MQGGALWFQNLTEYPHGVLGPIFPFLISSLHFINVQVFTIWLFKEQTCATYFFERGVALSSFYILHSVFTLFYHKNTHFLLAFPLAFATFGFSWLCLNPFTFSAELEVETLLESFILIFLARIAYYNLHEFQFKKLHALLLISIFMKSIWLIKVLNTFKCPKWSGQRLLVQFSKELFLHIFSLIVFEGLTSWRDTQQH